MPVAERKPDGEGGTHVLGALGGDRAPVQPDQLTDQREPDAAAFVGPGWRVLYPVKAIEQAGHLRRGDPPAGVRDAERGLPVLLAEPDVDGAVEGELQRVAQQVEDHLLPHLAVDVDRRAQRRTVHLVPHAGPLDGRLEDAGQLGREGPEVERLEPGLHPAGLDLEKSRRVSTSLPSRRPLR